jgi:hypothetical protein
MMMIDVKDSYRFDLMYELLLNHVMVKVEHQVQQLSDELKYRFQIKWSCITCHISFLLTKELFFYRFFRFVSILSGNVCRRVVSRGQCPLYIFLLEGVNEWIMKRWKKSDRVHTTIRFNFSSHPDCRSTCACVHFFRITYATRNNSIEKFNGRKHTTMIFVLK